VVCCVICGVLYDMYCCVLYDVDCCQRVIDGVQCSPPFSLSVRQRLPRALQLTSITET